MARIFPFAALRPPPEYAEQVAAPPFDVLSTEEARMMAKGNLYSFLRVDKAEIDLPPDVSPHDPSVYAKARENLNGLRANKVLLRDEKPNLYIYRMISGKERVQTGLACCADTEDYIKGVIKRHELTQPDKEKDRIDHINACEAHTGPIFMFYRFVPAVRVLMDEWAKNHPPLYDFIKKRSQKYRGESLDVSVCEAETNEVRHTVWMINDADIIKQLIDECEKIPYLYIADGHHRSAAAVKTAKPENNESRLFLSVLFPDNELTILDYNRLVRDLNGLDKNAFFKTVSEKFEISESEFPVKPALSHEYGVYMEGKWYRLLYKNPGIAGIAERLSVSILQNHLLCPVLGIENPQTDSRIDFSGGARGTAELERRVDSGEMALAFTLSPTTMRELLDVADAGLIMPPKSTWFEPKLLSGLLIHEF